MWLFALLLEGMHADKIRRAHQNIDMADMQAYGMPIKETDEAACVAWLMRLYQEKVAELDKK